MKKLLDYTGKKKKYQIEKLEGHYTDSIQNITDYLDGKKSAVGVTSGFKYLSVWYHWNFINDFVTTGNFNKNHLKKATLFGIESNNVRFFLGKKVETYHQAIPFEKAIKHLAQAFLLGWDELGFQYGNLLLKMLYGKQYKGGHPAYLHPWFLLEIFCKWQNISLDYSKLNAPKDMKIYSEILANWDTQDTDLLQKMVQQLVDFHIAQSDEDEYEDRTPDFPSSDYFVYPIEILFWLNIRSRLQLSDYQPDNDLMRLPINDYRTQHTDIPKIDLIEKAKQKLMQDYPNIAFEI